MSMDQDQALAKVLDIMQAFANNTGLSDAGAAPRRYLWTDAFAVCNFLQLYRQTGDERHRLSALQLVDQVHKVLGRFGDDDARSGWISGLAEQEGRQHPTIGGLRIGKPLPERPAHEPIDERLEWDRDGQYFHYLVKWVQALVRVALATGQSRYARWAVELARTAHQRFCYATGPGRTMRMYWKMSVDLSRPLVMSMGHHDPLDALVCYGEAQVAAARLEDPRPAPDLRAQIADCASMCAGRSWASDDPLGTGGLLADTLSLAQTRTGLAPTGVLELPALLADAAFGLQAFTHSGLLALPVSQRLAFRELGLAIGIHALEQLAGLGTEQAEVLVSRYQPLAIAIEEFWLQPRHQQSGPWRSHRDINSVMLATSLAPRAYLMLA